MACEVSERWKDVANLLEQKAGQLRDPVFRADIYAKLGVVCMDHLADRDGAKTAFGKVLACDSINLSAVEFWLTTYSMEGAEGQVRKLLDRLHLCMARPEFELDRMLEFARIISERVEEADLRKRAWREVLCRDPEHEEALAALERLSIQPEGRETFDEESERFERFDQAQVKRIQSTADEKLKFNQLLKLARVRCQWFLRLVKGELTGWTILSIGEHSRRIRTIRDQGLCKYVGYQLDEVHLAALGACEDILRLDPANEPVLAMLSGVLLGAHQGTRTTIENSWRCILRIDAFRSDRGRIKNLLESVRSLSLRLGEASRFDTLAMFCPGFCLFMARVYVEQLQDPQQGVQLLDALYAVQLSYHDMLELDLLISFCESERLPAARLAALKVKLRAAHPPTPIQYTIRKPSKDGWIPCDDPEVLAKEENVAFLNNRPACLSPTEELTTLEAMAEVYERDFSDLPHAAEVYMDIIRKEPWNVPALQGYRRATSCARVVLPQAISQYLDSAIAGMGSNLEFWGVAQGLLLRGRWDDLDSFVRLWPCDLDQLKFWRAVTLVWIRFVEGGLQWYPKWMGRRSRGTQETFVDAAMEGALPQCWFWSVPVGIEAPDEDLRRHLGDTMTLLQWFLPREVVAEDRGLSLSYLLAVAAMQRHVAGSLSALCILAHALDTFMPWPDPMAPHYSAQYDPWLDLSDDERMRVLRLEKKIVRRFDGLVRSRFVSEEGIRVLLVLLNCVVTPRARKLLREAIASVLCLCHEFDDAVVEQLDEIAKLDESGPLEMFGTYQFISGSSES